MLPALVRAPENPILCPEDIRFVRATGAFNPGAAVCHKTGRVALLVRVFEAQSLRSCVGLALSSDGVHIEEIRDRPVIAREAPYEEWGVEDCRVTFLADEGRYAITYTGYSAAGPRVCLITTDDLLDPRRYRRHGPRIAADDKNTVVFPEKVGGRYLILHRPMPDIVLAEVGALEDAWPTGGDRLVGPKAGSWRSSRVGAGAPPLRTRAGWLLPIHGATTIEEGNVYSMGWCLLDAADPRRVRHLSEVPALAPREPYEICRQPLPQVDPRNFRDGVRVVFPEGMVTRGPDLLVYYGAADVHVGVAKVPLEPLVAALELP